MTNSPDLVLARMVLLLSDLDLNDPIGRIQHQTLFQIAVTYAKALLKGTSPPESERSESPSAPEPSNEILTANHGPALASSRSHDDCEDSACELCCSHSDVDDAQCLDCGKDLFEDLSAEAYDRAKARRQDGD